MADEQAPETTPEASEDTVPENPEIPEDADYPDINEINEMESSQEEASEESTPEGEEELPGAEEETPEGEKETPEVPVLHKVKINGEEKEVDTQELVRGYQKQAASDAKFREAKGLHEEATKIKEAALNVLNALPDDPFRVMIDAMVAKYQMQPQQAYSRAVEAAKMLVKHDYELQNMPEPERKAYEAQTELERLKKEQEAFKQEKAQMDYESKKVQEVQKINAQMVPILKNLGLSDTDIHREGICAKMLYLRAAGENPTLQDAANHYLEDLKARRQKELQTLSPDELLSLYPEAAERIRKGNLERAAKRAKERVVTKPPASSPTMAAGALKRISSSEFMKTIRGG